MIVTSLTGLGEWLEILYGGVAYLIFPSYRKRKRAEWNQKGKKAMAGDVILWLVVWLAVFVLGMSLLLPQ
ncbi:MAG: hypothetical protein DHS20C11_28510 [Lysobacteraceae bacterium]|nr:MAG: hypothetical protein DHS20C11_28510 [Xanthomonadaceae bacterium]